MLLKWNLPFSRCAVVSGALLCLLHFGNTGNLRDLTLLCKCDCLADERSTCWKHSLNHPLSCRVKQFFGAQLCFELWKGRGCSEHCTGFPLTHVLPELRLWSTVHCLPGEKSASAATENSHLGQSSDISLFFSFGALREGLNVMLQCSTFQISRSEWAREEFLCPVMLKSQAFCLQKQQLLNVPAL